MQGKSRQYLGGEEKILEAREKLVIAVSKYTI